ncbi:hypothetical protein CFOL_v3_17780, partial [Cephalotus follicularis]
FETRAKTDCVVNNVAESFNAMILETRGLSIISMMEEIWKKDMVRIQERYAAMDWYDGIICPKIIVILEQLKHEARLWQCLWAGGDKYKVGQGREQYVVNLGLMTCFC